jgi:hypothetical protein
MEAGAWEPAFANALQRLVPEIQPRDLHAGGAGVRAQASIARANWVVRQVNRQPCSVMLARGAPSDSEYSP